VFAPEVGLDDLKAVDENPPAYVRGVDYGRIVMVKMETASSETKVSLEGALHKVTSSGDAVGGSADGKFSDIIQNSTFTAVALDQVNRLALRPDFTGTLDKVTIDLKKMNAADEATAEKAAEISDEDAADRN
jgi:thiol-activated cytolysin